MLPGPTMLDYACRRKLLLNTQIERRGAARAHDGQSSAPNCHRWPSDSERSPRALGRSLKRRGRRERGGNRESGSRLDHSRLDDADDRTVDQRLGPCTLLLDRVAESGGNGWQGCLPAVAMHIIHSANESWRRPWSREREVSKKQTYSDSSGHYLIRKLASSVGVAICRPAP